MSDQGKVYKRRPADDGGEYLLMPRDDDSPEIPVPPGEPVRLVMPMLDLPERAPKADDSGDDSAEVEAMVDAFFASLNKTTI